MRALIFLLFITISWADVILSLMNTTIDIYRWSKLDTFSNSSFHISEYKDSNSTSGTGNCLFLSGMKKLTAKSLIDQLPNSTCCVLILIEFKDLELWIPASNHYIDTPFPVGVIVDPTLSTLFQEYPIIDGTHRNWTPNPYFSLYTSTVVIKIILCIIFFLVAILGFYRLFEKYLDKQLVINISTICIGLETVYCLASVSSIIIDISFYLFPLNPIGDRIQQFIVYLAFPLTITSGVFVIFFWLGLTSNKLFNGSLLDKVFWPSFIFVICFLLIDYICAILWMTFIDDGTIFFVTAAILVFMVIIAIIYFITACRTYNYSKVKGTRTKEVFKRVTVKILISGIVMILIVLFSFLFLSISGSTATVIVGHLLNICLITRSLLLILIFSSKKVENLKTKERTVEANSQKREDVSSQIKTQEITSTK